MRDSISLDVRQDNSEDIDLLVVKMPRSASEEFEQRRKKAKENSFLNWKAVLALVVLFLVYVVVMCFVKHFEVKSPEILNRPTHDDKISLRDSASVHIRSKEPKETGSTIREARQVNCWPCDGQAWTESMFVGKSSEATVEQEVAKTVSTERWSTEERLLPTERSSRTEDSSESDLAEASGQSRASAETELAHTETVPAGFEIEAEYESGEASFEPLEASESEESSRYSGSAAPQPEPSKSQPEHSEPDLEPVSASETGAESGQVSESEFLEIGEDSSMIQELGITIPESRVSESGQPSQE